MPQELNLPQPPPIRLEPATRCLMVMEWKCRKCGTSVVGCNQLARMPSSVTEAETFTVQAFQKHPFKLHHCTDQYEGFIGAAPLQGVWFKFVIAITNGHVAG